MFTRRRDDNNGVTTTTATTTPSFFGRPVQNSIRPPSKTRQEHIDSYIKDGQLSPSTRKLSDGTYLYQVQLMTCSSYFIFLID
jgi:hypothetical protein